MECVRWDSLIEARAQVVVNGTSVGMQPREGESPVEANFFKKEMVAMDTVYVPRFTKFLRDAKAAGAETIDGVDMFLRQADAQFRIWTGRGMPREVVKEYAKKL